MLKGAIVLDPAGDALTSSAEQFKIWSNLFGRVFNKQIIFRRYGHPALLPPGVSVLLFDYGAAGSLADADVRSHIRGFMSWADDHPKSLGIVISQLTWHYITREFDPHLPNVLLWGRDKIPEWFEGSVHKAWRGKTT